MNFDQTLKTPEQRIEYVKKLMSETNLSSKNLELMADYILAAASPTRKREILSDNRMVTVNKRETSYEGLVSKFENGEDGIYNLMTTAPDKNVILSPKIEITQEDLDEIPGLKELKENIEKIEAQAKTATGRNKYLLKKQAIEMRQDQYVIKNLYKQPYYPTNLVHSASRIELNDNVYFDENGEPQSTDLVTLFNPKHVSAILCNYETLKIALDKKFSSDFHYLLEDFEDVAREALKDYPIYRTLIKCKIRGDSNAQIQSTIERKHHIKHSIEYISSLWRNKIPKLIANKAQERYLIWYYTEIERGNWKKCTRCGQIKLAHNRFFSKNKSSKDGFYSICKECRNAATKKEKKK